MKRLFGLLIALQLLTAASASEDQADVLRCDTALNAHIAANDAKSAAAFYHEDFVLTTSAGSRKSKGDMLAEIAQAGSLKFLINETTKTRIRQDGSTAILTGVLHQKGTYKDKEFDVLVLVTDTWVQSASGWKLLAGHASVISPEKAAALQP